MMANRIEAMKDQAEKLVALLKEPEPGLLSWREMVHARMTNLMGVYFTDFEDQPTQ